MATIYNENVTLDVTKKKPVETIKLRRGENGLTNIVANIVYNDAAYDLTGYEVHFCTLNKYKQFTHEPAKVTNASNGVVTYTVTDRVTAIAGETRVAYFEIKKGEQVLTSQTIPMYILDDASLTYEETQEYQNQIDNLLDQLEQGVKETNSAAKEAAETVEQAKGALSDANSALEKANKAVDNANAATGKANTAAQNADEAAANANSSATNANKAADKANSAAGNADEATAAANAAAKKANDAASRVDDSVSDAADATAAANSAATKANNAATSATNAASAANSAASSANTAASDANSAAAAANAAKTAVDTALARYKTIKSSKVDYQLGDSGTTAPTGEWSTTIPTIEQGRYLWVRLVVTFADKDNADAGTETVLIPAYQGRDGSFSGNERVEALEKGLQEANEKIDGIDEKITDVVDAKLEEVDEKLDSINDYTTGINLIRGSRDFIIGHENIPGVPSSAKRPCDGFSNGGGFTFYKDDNGFTVAKKVSSGLSSTVPSSVIDAYFTGINPSEYITVSFEVMIDDVGSFDSLDLSVSNLIVIKRDTNEAYFNVSRTLRNLIGTPKSGVWYSAKYTIELPVNVVDSEDFCGVRLAMLRNGSINFRKLMVQRGAINNPIWSASPFDLALEPVNDITTGINLLRGTRDFTEGSTNLLQNRYDDGWHVINTSPIKDSDGFYYFKSDSTSQSAYSNKSFGFVGTQYITISMEIMFTNTADVVDSTKIFEAAIYERDSFSGTLKGKAYPYTLANTNLSLDDIKPEKWYQIRVAQYIDYDAVDGAISLLLRNFNNLAGSVCYKKVCINKGNIVNPIWSASPFDVAQEREMTTSKAIAITDKVNVPDGWTCTNCSLYITNSNIVNYVISLNSTNQIEIKNYSFEGFIPAEYRPRAYAALSSVYATGYVNNVGGLIFRPIEAKSNGVVWLMGMGILSNPVYGVSTAMLPLGDAPLIGEVQSIEQSGSGGVDMLPSDGSQFVVEAPNIDSVEDAEEEN